ncbi:hypothetical protein EKL29_21295 [Pantoea sp. YU22]|uniref:hypothetical protein n=1 Tax=Pantoea sp. YU22 TaxID=2497684 RepID=UPI000F88F41E|nr:hypothetical protein [Pantoea sp. YU22]RTY53656.1 hypothetical protein EKL29_21295 [Pantoea sp. YU22]
MAFKQIKTAYTREKRMYANTPSLVVYHTGAAMLSRNILPDRKVKTMSVQHDTATGQIRLKQDAEGETALFGRVGTTFYLPVAYRRDCEIAKGSPAVVPLELAGDGWWYGQIGRSLSNRSNRNA